MPKGVYKRVDGVGRNHGRVWPDDVVATLQRELAAGKTYAQVLKAVHQQHPHFRTTRNALIGKATRMGFKSKNEMRNAQGVKASLERRKADPRLKPTKPGLVVSEGSALLREENEVVGPTHGPGWKRKHKLEDIERARQGYIPQIVEVAPRTSKPYGDLKRGECKWPTADDASMACGRAATCGAYCDEHASIAYRSMPSRKRHARFDKVQDIDRGRTLDHEVEATLQHFLDNDKPIGLATFTSTGFEQPLLDAVVEDILDD